MKCEYCGNTSGKTDSRGGCISCGGQLETISSHVPPHISIQNGWLTVAEAGQEWLGVTGGFSHRDDSLASSLQSLSEKTVGINILRRAVGLG